MGAKKSKAEDPQECIEVTITKDRKVQKKIVSSRTFVIGRGVDCNLQILDPKISRLHLFIEVDHMNRVYVTDRSSSGTHINEHKIQSLTRVQAHISDVILIGDTSLSFLSFFSGSENTATASIMIEDVKEPAKPVESSLKVAPLFPLHAHVEPVSNVREVTVELKIPVEEVLAAPAAPVPVDLVVPVPVSPPIPVAPPTPVIPDPVHYAERDRVLKEAKEQAALIIQKAEDKASQAHEVFFQKARSALSDATDEAERMLENAHEEIRHLRALQVEDNRKLASEALQQIEESRAQEVIAAQKMVEQRDLEGQMQMKALQVELDLLRARESVARERLMDDARAESLLQLEKDRQEHDELLKNSRLEAAKLIDVAQADIVQKQIDANRLLDTTRTEAALKKTELDLLLQTTNTEVAKLRAEAQADIAKKQAEARSKIDREQAEIDRLRETLLKERENIQNEIKKMRDQDKIEHGRLVTESLAQHQLQADKDHAVRLQLLEEAKAERDRLAEAARTEILAKQVQADSQLQKTNEEIRTLRDGILLDKARAESDIAKGIASAQAESARLLEVATTESRSVLETSRASSQNLLATAKTESQNLLDSARSESQALLESARTESQALLENARTELARTQNEMQALIQQTEQDLRKQRAEVQNDLTLLQTKTRVESEQSQKLAATLRQDAQSFLETTRAEALQLKADSTTEAERRLKEAADYSSQLCNKALQESESMRRLAQADAENLRQDAGEKSRKLHVDTMDEISRLRSQHEKECELRLKQMLDEARITADRDLEDTRKKTQTEKRALEIISNENAVLQSDVKSASLERDRLRAETAILSQAVAKDQKIARDTTLLIGGLETQKQSLQEKVLHLRSEVDQTQKNLQTKITQAEQEIRTAQEKSRQALLDIKKNQEQQLQTLMQENEREAERLQSTMLQTLHEQKRSLIQIIQQNIWKGILTEAPTDLYAKLEHRTLQDIDSALETYFARTSANFLDQKKTGRRQNLRQTRWLVSGALAGSLVVGAMWFVKERAATADYNAEIEHEAQARKEELAARKFDPPQDDTVRETYTDSVIYTRDFVTVFSDDAIQARWLSEITKMMYQKWKIDEDTTVRVVAMSQSLVKLLDEKKRNIHPDFVKENLLKMQDLEDETVKKMKDELGTSVKFEAFKKAEIKFVTGMKNPDPSAGEHK